MKKKVIACILILSMAVAQMSQVSGTGLQKNSENSARQIKEEEQKALAEAREKKAEKILEKRTLEEEKQRLLDEEEHYSDRFLVKYADTQAKKAAEREVCAKQAYTGAKEQKNTRRKAVKTKIKDAEEQKEFSQMTAQERKMGPEQPEFVETTGEYDMIRLPEKVAPEAFMETFLKESGEEVASIQPDYAFHLASELVEEPKGEGAGKSMELSMPSEQIQNGNAVWEEGGWDAQEPGQNPAAQVQESILDREADLKEVWKISRGSGIVIALIDTGVDVSHPDLDDHMLSGYDFVNGRESVYDAGLGMEQAHGTHIAGILAKSAPEAKILPLKVFENGSAYTSDILEAVAYAKEQGADIVNMSFGSADGNPALQKAMEESGMFFVCAAGNHRRDLSETPVYPAAFSLENSVSVGALNQDLGMAYMSNYGENVDIAAWGRDVYSCFPEGSYGFLDGTSIAAGYVSAAAALSAAAFGTKDLKKRLSDGADKLSCLEEKIARGNKVSFSGTVSGAVKTGVTEVMPEEDFDETYELLSPEEKWELFDSGRNTAIGAGARHALALKEDGSVWAWGYNAMGQLGNGSTEASRQPVRTVLADRIASISAGWTFSMALSKDGTIYTWGDNGSGQLGNGTRTGSNMPVRVVVPSEYGKVKKISCGLEHNLALTEEGKVLAWGSNVYGELGDGTEVNRLVPVEVQGLSNIVEISAGNNSSMALDENGKVWVWGKDVPGHVGDETRCTIARRIDFSSYYEIKNVSIGCGWNSALIENAEGLILGWGKECLANGFIIQTPQLLKNPRDDMVKNIQQIAIGMHSTLALREDGIVLGWGINSNAELGNGNTNQVSLAIQIYSGIQAVATGMEFSMMLKKDGTIVMAGDNSYGQCAQNGDIGICYYPTEVVFDDNTSFHTAKPIRQDEAMCGELLKNDERRYYSFIPPKTAIYSFESISDFDTCGDLYSQQKVCIQSNDDGEGLGESSNNKDFYMQYELTGGQIYYLSVRSSNSSSAGAYAVKAKYVDDCGNDIQHAKLIEQESTKGIIDYLEDIDVYRFIPEKTGYYEMQSVSGHGLVGTLMNSAGQSIAVSSGKDPDVGESHNILDFYIFHKLTEGQVYYVSVEGGRYKPLQINEEYTLKISYKDDYLNDREHATLVQAGTGKEGRIDYAGDIDMFRFIPDETAYYTMESISNFDTYGILYNVSGEQIAFNDDGSQNGESTNSRDFCIKYALIKNTTYYIAVKASSPLATGDYTFKIYHKDDYGGVISSAHDISGSYMTEGSVDYFGDTDAFVFIPKKSGTYIISTMGNTVLGGVSFKIDNQSNTTGLPLEYRGNHVVVETNMNAGEKHYLMIYNKDNLISSLGAYQVYVETPLTVTIE